jgi:purine-binding chemotaxis protein CheW
MSSASTNSRTARPAELPHDHPDDETRPEWLVVRVGGVRRGIPIAQVREVLRAQGLRRVPGTPPVHAGIVNVRGAIVTVLDAGCHTDGTDEAEATAGPRAVSAGSIVLLAYGTRPIGIAVDSVEGVSEVEADHADHPRTIRPFDAVAWCARHLHSAEERER